MFSVVHFALPLMERLREEGFHVEALGGFDGSEDRVRDAGFAVHRWCADHTFNPLVLWRARRQLAQFLKRHPFDIVHTHCSFGGIVGNPVAYPRARNLLYTQHGFYVHQGLDVIRRALWLAVEKIGLRSAHRVICISEAERDLATTLRVGPADKFYHVPGAGVRTQDFHLEPAERQRRREAIRGSLGIGQHETVLLTLSRLTWDKGYREMIEAARRLKAEGVPCKFLAAGSGKDERAIGAGIRQAQLGSDFVLLGWRDDVVDLHCAADIFVFASHREGLPIAPIEAMASGLPVVASDIPGCREEIEDGQSGLLYPVGNAEALARQIRRLLEDSTLTDRLARGAPRRARAFDLQRVLDRQVELYYQLAGMP